MVTNYCGRRLLTGSGTVEYPVIRVEDGIILAIEEGPTHGITDTFTPSFLDIHVHGACSYDFMTAQAPEIEAIGLWLAANCGVGHYLATTVTAPLELTLRALERLATAVETEAGHGVAQPVGIHLEGPFISCAKRGVHPLSCLLPPSVALFERFQAAARGQIRLITLAPELPGALELIAHATAAGVRVSLGHSDATEAEALAGIAAGARSATHCFNAMRPLGHREPGIAGAVLDHPDTYAELICDGVHVAPAMVRLWLKMKGLDRAILVTDGMSATGMPDGEYNLGELRVQVTNGVCLLDGVLAGSVLTMDQAVANVRRFTGISLADAVRLASTNPARMLGLQAGHIAVGQPANFCLFDQRERFLRTELAGRQ